MNRPPPSFKSKSIALTNSKQPSNQSKNVFSAFNDSSSEEDLPGPSRTTSAPKLKLTGTNNALIAHQGEKKLGRQAKKVQEEALKVDKSVFEYDQVWDGMQDARKQEKDLKDMESLERKPKYIEAFLNSASTRRLDRLRAEEKMLQHERDKEGDEFQDKEKFVTGAYKAQMEEVRVAEEEERRREENDRAGKKGPGMTTFYSSMLADSEAKHSAAVAATKSTTTSSTTSSGPSLTICPPSAKQQQQQQQQFDPEPEEDKFLQREAARQRQEALLAAALTTGPVKERLEAGVDTSGDKLEINDEGSIVDKRVLLKAGLNLTKKPIIPMTSLSGKSGEVMAPYQSRAVGSSASHAERIAREKTRLERLLKDESERERRVKMEKEKEEEEKAKKRRLGGEDKESGEAKRKAAKERFEERKRRKVEDAGLADRDQPLP